MKACLFSTNSGFVVQRSGMNSVGREKFRASRWSVYVGIERIVSRGMYVPSLPRDLGLSGEEGMNKGMSRLVRCDAKRVGG